MKYTYNALTSITVEKVENIITSMTRAGVGDDTYRRQRDKERYLKCKAEHSEKEERQREEFLQQRNKKQAAWEDKSKKKSLQRQKKKDRQKLLLHKNKFIKKFDKFHLSDAAKHQQEHLSQQNSSEQHQIQEQNQQQNNIQEEQIQNN